MSEVASADPSANPDSANAVRNEFRPLRIWPAALLLVVLWSLRIVPGFIDDPPMAVLWTQFMGPAACATLIVLWWLLLSRANWKERLIGAVGLSAIGVASALLLDKSLHGFGMVIFVAPWGITAFTVALIILGRHLSPRRTWLALLAATIGFGYWDLVRADEFRGDFQTVHSWRWQPTAEERFLKSLAERAPPKPDADFADQPLAAPEWPAFRGPHRTGIQPGIILAADWQAAAPKELWRIKVGPGWSSFSVAGDRLFTQEQRGEEEVVVCYDAQSGQQLWVHASQSRFWETIGGAGPRATPTLDGGRLYALGANGLLHCLDPRSGDEIWRQDISVDAGREPPTWGFSSSPLVTADVVVVHAGGNGENGILAYDRETGELQWGAPTGDHSYSSPQLAEIHGKTCVLMLTNDGLTIVDPTDGAVVGEHAWKNEFYRVVQPVVVDESSVLLGTAMGGGTQRVELRPENDKFATAELWTSRRMSPYFNDYVVHEGHLYGFDNNIFACVDLADGTRKWKRGRYGNGQVLLLPDGGQLLVISEDGELVLLSANPKKHVELTKFRVLEGRTWNHPVLVGNRLFVRNAEEAACFEMPLDDRSGSL